MTTVANAYKGLRKQWARSFRRAFAEPRLDRAVLDSALQSLEPRSRRVVMVHSSLSACGYIRGGAQTVIKALRGWVEETTLAMPTHTYCYPASNGASEVYDSQLTASRVGMITDAFWRLDGVFRSQHPTHSLACEGGRAEDLIAGHDKCDTPCGKGTPYEKLIDWDASILMFGATLNAYTLFHTAEDAAQLPYLYEKNPYQLRIRQADGSTSNFQMWRQNMKVERRFSSMDTWLEDRGLLKRRVCGSSELLFVPSAAAVHETLIKALRNDPWLLVKTDSSSNFENSRSLCDRAR
jgi:aminoglycoside 3-N-acetyltransferase